MVTFLISPMLSMWAGAAHCCPWKLKPSNLGPRSQQRSDRFPPRPQP